MKKEELVRFLKLMLTPFIMVLLGLLLVVRPDSASAVVGRVVGWILALLGGGMILGTLLLRDITAGRVLFAAVTLAMGVWLLRNPLRLAAAIGRIAGLMILIRGVQDIINAARWKCSMRYAVVACLVGGVLILLPMTTSRVVMVLLGLLVTALGVLMGWDRLKLGRLLPDGSDRIIDV